MEEWTRLRLRHGDLSRTIDFHFGSIRCELTAPSDYLGRTLSVEAVDPDSERGRARSHVAESELTQFEIPVVPPGDYQLRVGFGFNRASIWLPGSAEREDAAIVHVSPLDRTEMVGTLPALGRLRGAVTGSWQELAAGKLHLAPRVALFGADSTESLSEARVEADGSFEFLVMHSVAGKVRVEIQDHFRWIGGPDFEAATAYELSPGRTVEGAELLESGLRVRLVLPGIADDGYVFVHATLTDAAKRLILERRDLFAPEGYLGIPNLSAGTYYLNLQPGEYGDEDWVPQWFDGSRFLATATPIVIEAEGSVTDVLFHPSRGGQLPIRIRRPDGFPVPYGTIALFEIGQPTRYFGGFQQADDEGRFLFRGLWTGTWKLGFAELGAERLIWYPGTFDVDAATSISIVDGQEAPLIEWDLLP